MRRIWLSLALALACIGSIPARAQTFTSVTWGVNRAAPTSASVCILKNGICLVQIGTANLSTGVWTPAGGSGGPLPVDANGILLPTTSGIGQLSVASSVVGMTPNTGFDNASRISTLMNAITPTISLYYQQRAVDVIIPGVVGSPTRGPDEYYFSSTLSFSRGGAFKCVGGLANNSSGASVALVFAPGVDGVVFEDRSTSSDGGFSEGSVSGCYVTSLGNEVGVITNGGTSITGARNYSARTIRAPPWAAGDGVIAGVGGWGNPAGINISQGAYIDSVSGSSGSQTLNLHSGFTTSNAGNAALWRLPANLAFNVTTTSGSDTFTVTSGSFLLQGGDLIWSDAWPFGATVFAVSGSLGAQTVIVHDMFLSAGSTGLNASVTHRSGSGKLWKIPAGIRHRITSEADNNAAYGFPIGEQASCATGTPLNCTTTFSSKNAVGDAVVGSWWSGNNSGGSSFRQNSYYADLLWDIAEFSAPGNNYIGVESNSADDNAVASNCYGYDNSLFSGVYIEGGGLTFTTCVTPQISMGRNSTPFFLQPTARRPTDVPSQVGLQLYPDESGARIYNGAYGSVYLTAGSWGAYGLLGLSTYGITPTPTDDGWSGWHFDATSSSWVNLWRNSGSYEFQRTLLMNNTYYPGDSLGYTNFHRLTIGSGAGYTNLIASDRTTPNGTTYPNSVQGDLHFNHAAAAGGNIGWTYNGSAFLPFGPISNSTRLRDYTLDVLRSGSSGNTDLTGRVTLSGGTYTLTLTGAYASAPNCWTADVTTPANASYAVESTTQVVFHGTGTDVIKYGCVGRN